mmetsp:Transcript_93126/g.290313  ORF Transcript_93126/g.290313 Transcript_93126/m.290313 type:complete len:408 (+) Transcript_93126:81-1304(+)
MQTNDNYDSLESAELLVQYIAEGKLEEAETHVDGLVKTSKKSCKALHHTLIHACSKLNSSGAALWCALRMVRIGLKPNTVTFNALLDCAAKTCDVALATRLWDLMQDLNVSPNSITYNTMMNVCAKAKNARLAEWWLERMCADGMPACAVSFHIVIAAYANVGQFEKAESWFKKMQQAGVKPDAVIYNSMIGAGTKARNLPYVERWVSEMERAGMVPAQKAYCTVVSAWLKNGNPERAALWVERMERQGFVAGKDMMTELVDALVSGGSTPKAKRWINDMVTKGMAPDHQFNAVAPSRQLTQQGMVPARQSSNDVAQGNLLKMQGTSPVAARAHAILEPGLVQRNKAAEARTTKLGYTPERMPPSPYPKDDCAFIPQPLFCGRNDQYPGARRMQLPKNEPILGFQAF